MELDQLLADLLRVQAARDPTISASESTLFARIDSDLPSEIWTEYHRLQNRRMVGTLTAAEQAELIRLTDQVEEYQADRAGALNDLAALRGKTLAELADELALGPIGE